MAKYDDASWHYGGDFPKDLPEINGAIHIGMFLAWCIDNDLLSKEQYEDNPESIQEVKNRTLTGAEFLMDACDEKFTDEDLNTKGDKFAKAYYQFGNSRASKFSKNYADYMSDYSEFMTEKYPTEDDFYTVENSWENYYSLKTIIDQRFKEWQVFIKKI
jgi:hypothetical protein